MRSRLTIIAASVTVLWILYEAVMAYILRDEFAPNDWAALAAKLSYLAGLLAASLKDRDTLQAYAATASPGLAAAVRATQGWLGYTWFTVVLPLIGLAASLAGARLGREWRLLALFNGLVLAYMALTLAGSVYQAPQTLQEGDVAVFLVAHPLSLALAKRRLGSEWVIVHLASLLAVVASIGYWPPVG